MAGYEDINWIDGAPDLSAIPEDGVVMITVCRRGGVLHGGWAGAIGTAPDLQKGGDGNDRPGTGGPGPYSGMS